MVELTDRAIEQVQSSCRAEGIGEEGGLRLAVKAGGCSGFQYDMSLVDKAEADDVVEEIGGCRVFVDPFSAMYLEGCQIDYVSALSGSGFTFKNPNASGGCGCGTSFSA